MSKWFTIEEQEDVEITDDGNYIYIYLGSDDDGNIWAEVPIAFIHNLLNKQNEK